LFNYVQLFVISNGVDTKYYANNRKQDFKQTFYWSKRDNTLVTQLDEFAELFLETCHVSKMICKYIVLHESDKVLMVLRPYQYYAVEALVERVLNSRKNGYIWHTTGSGKTLTSFKAAAILSRLPKVHKVVFVVDRADLDYQTTVEFNHFSAGSVDGTENTRTLVKQMAGENALIVTTLQKLNSAIKRPRHEKAMEALKDKRMVFIFDECHRSQFGRIRTLSIISVMPSCSALPAHRFLPKTPRPISTASEPPKVCLVIDCISMSSQMPSKTAMCLNFPWSTGAN